MSIPGLIYFAMGAIVARLLLDGTQTQSYRLMDWFHLAFNISRIIILWPLVLFIEKIEEWLKQEPKVAVQVIEDAKMAGVFKENWQFDNAVPIPIPVTDGREVRRIS